MKKPDWLSVVLAGTLALSALPASAEDAPAPPPLPADLPPAVRAYLEALQKKVDDLEKKLNQQQKASPTPPGSLPAPSAPPAAPPVPSARTVTAPLGSRLQIGGYAELRITNFGNAIGDRTAPHNNLDFQIARFRPRLQYFMDNNWEANLQINATTRSVAAASFTARDAYLEWHNGLNNALAIRFGQHKTPFGFQTWVEGDEPRAALERARYQEILIPDQRDTGASLIYNPTHKPFGQAQLRGPIYGIGVYNGNSINKQDNDQSKNVVAEARWAVGKNNTVGLSGLSGTFSPAPGKTFVKQAGNFDWETYYGRVRTQMELMIGRNLGHDVTGGFGQLEYVLGRAGSPFFRYDYFDPSDGPGQDFFKRYTIGWYKDFTRNIRVTGEYDWVTNNARAGTKHPNTFGIELQGNF